MMRGVIGTVLACSVLAGCFGGGIGRVTRADSGPPPMAWDHRPEAGDWTAAALDMLRGDAAGLVAHTPRDIDTWCPGYEDAGARDRAAFWSGFLSTLARYESTWNPEAVGGGGRWFGLMQISPATARYRGCVAGSGAALQDGEANLRCALRILSVTVPRDGVVTAGRGGAAADWGPLTRASTRNEMRGWLRAQPYCAG